MAAFIGKIVTKRIFGEKIENKFGVEDPYFEQVPATRLDGTPKAGKFKKVRKALPPGISEHDAQVLTKAKRRAYRLDMSFGSFMGLKFGWGSIIGIFPVAGDFADALLALLVVRTAKQIEGGLPFSLLICMYFWVAVDLVAGLIPFVGDILDAAILANTRNVKMLEDHLREKGKKNLRVSGLPVPEVDPSDPAEFDRFNSEPPTNHTRRDTRSADRSRNSRRPQNQPSQPAQAKVRDDGRGGFFGYGSKRSRPADEEMGTEGVAQRDPPYRAGRRG
ncbi:hypothetical protein F5X99DRAFT_235751 [Biscogniauxia marginata]|nr:hypothetical protein F5X99DRAFT_235751 [Biscogniauxia marginata]